MDEHPSELQDHGPPRGTFILLILYLLVLVVLWANVYLLLWRRA
jgi:hypothetical protein